MMQINAAALLLLLVAVCSVGCQTTLATIDVDLSSEELFRLAQDAYSDNNNRLALTYYAAIVERFGDERSVRVAAEYEIAYIYFRMGDLKRARMQFAALLAEYRINPTDFPRWTYVLTNSLYAQIAE